MHTCHIKTNTCTTSPDSRRDYSLLYTVAELPRRPLCSRSRKACRSLNVSTPVPNSGFGRNRRSSYRERICASAASGAESGKATGNANPAFELRCLIENGERTLQNVESGDLLREALLSADPPVGVYTLWGKVANCNGSGQCGTCIIEVVDGEEYLSEKSDVENKKLKKKPSNYRLSCQTNIGDGEDSGAVCIRTLPP